MISVSRKDMLEALKWAKKFSPVAYLVLSMNGKWGTPKDNAMNIVAAFKRLWPETRAYLKTVATMSYKGGGRIIPADLDINYPQKRIKNEIHNDFFLLLKEMTRYMDEAEDYEAMVPYCRDMHMRWTRWKGTRKPINSIPPSRIRVSWLLPCIHLRYLNGAM